MKLYMWPTSPYVAKVLAVAEFKQLQQQIELVYIYPWQKDSFIPQDNPLGKIPTLVTDEVGPLYDSSVICEYLDNIGQGSKLFPEGDARWQALRLQSLANGIMDAGVSIQVEKRMRPQGKQSEDWIARQLKAIERSLFVANDWATTAKGDCIGSISVGTAVAYLQLRIPEILDKQAYPQLLNWFDEYIKHPYMSNNRPVLRELPDNLEQLVA